MGRQPNEIIAGLEGLRKNSHNSGKCDSVESKSDAHDKTVGRGAGAMYEADPKSKPDGQTLKSKTTPQPADNKNQVQPLKSNSGIRSWNKLSENPPKALLNDPDIRRWHDNLRRSSAITCSVRLRRLNLFCSRVGVTPHELANMD